MAAVLNTRGHIAAPMWTPILNKIVVIATAGAFIMIWSNARELGPAQVTMGQVLVLGVGTTLGIVVQAAGLFPALRKVGFHWRWRVDLRRVAPPGLGPGRGLVVRVGRGEPLQPLGLLAAG